MRSGPVVSDSSPIIAFHAIGRLDVLEGVFGEIVVPSVVVREVAPSVPQLPRWIRIGVDAPTDQTRDVRGLDAGERAAIELALKVAAAALVVDDLAARRWGTRLGLRVTGSDGVAVRAKERGIVAAARPLIDALIERGLYLDRRTYRKALTEAGEPFDPPVQLLPQ